MTHVENSLAAILLLTCLSSAHAVSGQETVIHSFSVTLDSGAPNQTLLMDAKGNLYGTADDVFRLSPVQGGGWTEDVLHHFDYPWRGLDGSIPAGALISDPNGNLYGTTVYGGLNPAFEGGTVFELTPAADGSWTETVLYSFGASATDGYLPRGNLVLDAKGNLYGTTTAGGALRGGTAYELTPVTGGWAEKVLHSFSEEGTDGQAPVAGLVIDTAGNLYGTTAAGGGIYGEGTVFKLVHQHDGSWSERILHVFKPSLGDGAGPLASLILDSKGNLYGTTFNGGTLDGGTVFELSPATGGGWTEKIFNLDAFPGYCNLPDGPVTIDSQGRLYGMTEGGGPHGGQGIVFQLSPDSDGAWEEKVLHEFGGFPDGAAPFGGVIFDSQGNLYGTTTYGGAYNDGAAFEIGAASIAMSGVATTTTLVINPNTNLLGGEPISLTATVVPASGAAFPTGTVRFSDPAVAGLQIEVPLNALGKATFYGKIPNAGSYSIVASYTGAQEFVPSSSETLTRTVP